MPASNARLAATSSASANAISAATRACLMRWRGTLPPVPRSPCFRAAVSAVASGGHRGNQPESRGESDRDQRNHGYQATVRPNSPTPRCGARFRQACSNEARAGRCWRARTPGRTDETEQHGLRRELRDDAGPRRAESRADRELALPIVRASEQQPRQIEARDEQDESSASLENPDEGSAGVFSECGGQCPNRHAALAIRDGILLFEPAADDVELGLRAGERAAGCELPEHGQRPAAAIGAVAGCEQKQCRISAPTGKLNPGGATPTTYRQRRASQAWYPRQPGRRRIAASTDHHRSRHADRLPAAPLREDTGQATALRRAPRRILPIHENPARARVHRARSAWRSSPSQPTRLCTLRV